MSDAELLQTVRDIALYFGVKAPDPAVVSIWHDTVKFIPFQAVPYIVKRITAEADRMPPNMPKKFRALYEEWQAQQPQQAKQQQVQGGGCPYCYDGLLWLVRGTETAVIYCTCYRGNPGHVGRATLAAMEQKGWRLQELRLRGTHRSRPAIEAQLQKARKDYVFPERSMSEGYDYDQPFY